MNKIWKLRQTIPRLGPRARTKNQASHHIYLSNGAFKVEQLPNEKIMSDITSSIVIDNKDHITQLHLVINH